MDKTGPERNTVSSNYNCSSSLAKHITSLVLKSSQLCRSLGSEKPSVTRRKAASETARKPHAHHDHWGIPRREDDENQRGKSNEDF